MFVLIKDCKWSSSTFGTRPPEINKPASMFFSMAWPVRFALVIKQTLASATATLAWTLPPVNSWSLSPHLRPGRPLVGMQAYIAPDLALGKRPSEQHEFAGQEDCAGFI